MFDPSSISFERAASKEAFYQLGAAIVVVCWLVWQINAFLNRISRKFRRILGKPRHSSRWYRERREERKRTANAFYRSEEWNELRKTVLRTYGCVCMKCGVRNTVMQVDHIKPRSKHPELALSFDNLQVLCRECNTLKSNKHETDYRKARKARYQPRKSRKSFRERFDLPHRRRT